MESKGTIGITDSLSRVRISSFPNHFFRHSTPEVRAYAHVGLVRTFEHPLPLLEINSQSERLVFTPRAHC